MISSIFSTTQNPLTVTLPEYLIALAVALLLGILIAIVGRFRSKQTRSLSTAIALLPMIVQTIIMLVNREFGAGLAVAGAFGLVRFRSAPASARDMVLIALSVAVGLACGMGLIGVAAILTVLVLAILLILTLLNFGRSPSGARNLRIVIPETLNYTDVFEDVFRKYTTSHELVRVKTTTMGSLFHLQYDIMLRDPALEKEFIDELRVRNGNLEIVCASPDDGNKEI